MRLSEQKHVLEEEVPLSRRQVWDLLARTDHLNRVIGLFPVNARQWEKPGIDDPNIRVLTAKAAGIVPVSWKEHPFEWVKEERYAVTREYTGGPLKRFYGGIELEDAGTLLKDGSRATRVRLFAYFTPANPLGLLAIPLLGVRSMQQTMRYLHSFIRLKEQHKAHLLPQPQSGYSVNQAELDALLDKLSNLRFAEDTLLQRLEEHLYRSGDDEVVDMRPYVLAESWGADREAVLSLFLHATKLGVTNLRWHFICPNCRVAKAGADTMSEWDSKYHCDYCGISYEVNFDRYVELCFSVHPSIRRADKQVFCVGGPMLTPHIYTQLDIADEGEAVLTYPRTNERLRIRVLRHNQIVRLYEEQEQEQKQGSRKTPVHPSQKTTADDLQAQSSLSGHPGERKRAALPEEEGSGRLLSLTFDSKGWSEETLVQVEPGRPLRLLNRSGSRIVVALEREEWDNYAVSAAQVTTMQEFRSLFASEVLSPGRQVGIESVTILFSDLLGSTAFYEQVGDALAYSQVREHFDFLQHWIRMNRGTLVKTIGDAVMAVFQSPEQAVKAAVDIQTHVDGFNLAHSSSLPIVVKIGLYSGPAIAVHSNGQLDYFGRTVNLASRTQGLSLGGDIMLSQECVDRPGVQALLEAYRIGLDRFEQRLKGIDEVIPLARIQVLQPISIGSEGEAAASADSDC